MFMECLSQCKAIQLVIDGTNCMATPLIRLTYESYIEIQLKRHATTNRFAPTKFT